MFLFWFIFAIFGVVMYKGKLNYCQDPMEFHITEEMCHEEHKHWITFRYNFENVLEAMSFLFVVASGDVWGELM
jgi:hypothetical protein